MVIFETTKVFGAFLAQKFGRMDLFCYLCGVKAARLLTQPCTKISIIRQNVTKTYKQ